ncbi:LLM class F420-dependent oxidoreductase [Herbiconiux sp.]|uniref:LLM class F420-dependent oxidoreductase n=1 Tax=Herbiconiux sp. TaxID=1871186 RepID=UPI0025C0FF6A|nr:LLM class F420-dependent oxidoreductase [Herbiconiux sp.]
MELGLHLANLTFEGGPAALAPTLARVAREAEAGGIARLTVMDHLWQIRGVGPAENDMLEAYTLLGFLAAHTERMLLHCLVTGVTYRAPGLLAKQIATLDVLSGGRAGLGIGAAWNEEEATGLGLLFPSTKERFERLEETLQICLQMWSDDDGPFDGAHYQLGRTLSVPAPLSKPHPYLMIGGSGERKTLRLVAQYADACNIFFGDESAHKLEVLRGHADAVGRDYDSIEKTTIIAMGPDATRDSVLASLETAARLGFTVTYLTPGTSRPLEAVDLIAGLTDEAAAL